jgi:hypothetical protein
MKELIYRNIEHENLTREGLQETKAAYEKLLSVWNEQKLGPCDDLFLLASQPVKVYEKAYYAAIDVPETVGKIQISRQGFMNLVEVPTPNSLYVAAKAAAKSSGFGYRDAFSIKDGSVYLDPEKVEEIINSQNIYALNPEQKELGEACIEYVRLSNFIDKRFTEIPWQYLPAVPFTLTDRHLPLVASLSLEVEQLRIILAKV